MSLREHKVMSLYFERYLYNRILGMSLKDNKDTDARTHGIIGKLTFPNVSSTTGGLLQPSK